MCVMMMKADDRRCAFVFV